MRNVRLFWGQAQEGRGGVKGWVTRKRGARRPRVVGSDLGTRVKVRALRGYGSGGGGEGEGGDGRWGGRASGAASASQAFQAKRCASVATKATEAYTVIDC